MLFRWPVMQCKRPKMKKSPKKLENLKSTSLRQRKSPTFCVDICQETDDASGQFHFFSNLLESNQRQLGERKKTNERMSIENDKVMHLYWKLLLLFTHLCTHPWNMAHAEMLLSHLFVQLRSVRCFIMAKSRLGLLHTILCAVADSNILFIIVKTHSASTHMYWMQPSQFYRARKMSNSSWFWL